MTGASVNRRRAGGRRDRGSGDALALVLLAPASIALALLVVALGRQVDSRAQVHSAAEAAAQAAALQRTGDGAHQAAQAAASAILVDTDTCADPVVGIDLSEFSPGGSVAVVVSCTVSTRGVELAGVPTVSFSARAVATIDPYRTMDASP